MKEVKKSIKNEVEWKYEERMKEKEWGNRVQKETIKFKIKVKKQKKNENYKEKLLGKHIGKL